MVLDDPFNPTVGDVFTWVNNWKVLKHFTISLVKQSMQPFGNKHVLCCWTLSIVTTFASVAVSCFCWVCLGWVLCIIVCVCVCVCACVCVCVSLSWAKCWARGGEGEEARGWTQDTVVHSCLRTVRNVTCSAVQGEPEWIQKCLELVLRECVRVSVCEWDRERELVLSFGAPFTGIFLWQFSMVRRTFCLFYFI